MVTILEEKHNPLFKRKEVILEVVHDSVPSQLQAEEIVSKKFNCNHSLVRIRKIDSRFGSNNFSIIADIYDSKDEFDRIVKKTKQEIEAEKKAEEERQAKIAEEKALQEAAKAQAEVEEVAKEMANDNTPSEEIAEAATQSEKKDEGAKE